MVYLANSDFINMKNNVLHIENLSKSFNGLKLFDTVNLSLEKCTISSLFGSNGTGKTTFFNLIGGYEKPNNGKIYFNGNSIKYHNEYTLAKAGIGRMWQNPSVFPNHSVMQNLLVSYKNHPGERFLPYFYKKRIIKRKENEIKMKALSTLKRFKLEGKENVLAGNLSLGEKKLLSISMLVISDASLLLLDEPFSNVNSNTIECMSEVLFDLKKDGKTIFMIEHKVKFAKSMSDRCFMIENQKIKMCEIE